MSFLQVTGLRKNYGAVAALDGIDLAVPAVSRTAIVGPSGCGKTTLLRLIAGFEMPGACCSMVSFWSTSSMRFRRISAASAS
jgi:iron(III) transport system ATP-binding protein